MLKYRRKFYPKDWESIARALKEACNWRCQYCNIRQGDERISQRTGKPYTIYLHAAHKRLHETENPEAELLCLCPTCHGQYDYGLRQLEWIVRLEILKHRLLLQRHFSPDMAHTS